MNRLLFHLLVLGNACLLVLPAGWCCFALPQTDGQQVPVAVASCCTVATPHAGESSEPAAPQVECCCSEQTAVTTSRVEWNIDPAVILLPPAITPSRPTAGHPPTAILADYGPRLHVLQCVWRC
ncbi:hypothetical protein [Lignipirellula cremea]|uniref:Secreted protein n=1 Tax=Lignipirellula cremea TaxID=2528010 RepID=A0A518DSB7_9BACT|nr:hypothetical protein [Lignipirellula cremea]QDU94736.1 hypothetical protein Pla8534_25420 [Lignipirellula cremea]